MKANRAVQNYRDLEVYKESFRFQQAVFQVTNEFPKEERYALTDQVRRSSRSIGANIAEAWAKRRYEAHFLSKLTDADGELRESTHWLRSAFACEYLTKALCSSLMKQAEKIGKMLGRMIETHETFCHPPKSRQ
jgi:four helix bundle protein